MSQEPTDVSTAFNQYRDNVNKIKDNIDGIIDRLVENFDNIHANPVVQKQIEDSLNRMNVYLDIHIPWHTKYNETIKCFPPLYNRSKKILDKLIELQDDITTLLSDLNISKTSDKSIYRKKIIPKLRQIVKQYREISLINELKQCIETIIIKPLTFIDERIIHPIKEWFGPKKEPDVVVTPSEELILSDIMQRIAKTMPKPEQEGAGCFSRRRRNKLHRRKKTRKNIRKKLNGLY